MHRRIPFQQAPGHEIWASNNPELRAHRQGKATLLKERKMMESSGDSSESSSNASTRSLNESDITELTPIKTKIQFYWDCPEPEQRRRMESRQSSSSSDSTMNGRTQSVRTWIPGLGFLSRRVEDLQVISRPDDDEEFESLLDSS